MKRLEALTRLMESGPFWRAPFETLSSFEQVFMVVWETDSEIMMGGLSQYYSNSAGDHALLAASSFQTIGAPLATSIIEEANLLFGRDGPSVNREKRSSALKELSKEAKAKLDDLTDQYVGYPDNITERLYAYAQANRAQIRGELQSGV